MVNTLAAQTPRTLIADDQPDVLAALRLLLKGAGYQTEAANSPAAVLDALKHEQFDLVLEVLVLHFELFFSLALYFFHLAQKTV